MSNNMRDRLINLIDDSGRNYDDYVDEQHEIGMPVHEDFTEWLADDLIANGIVLPPVSVGQKVWYIKGGYYNSVNKKPCEIKVTEINKKQHGKILDWGFIANGTRYRFSSIGKTVFLTKEEAESKLKECETDDE